MFNARAIGNKHEYICDRITMDKLVFCAVVETWHDASDSSNLIACAQPCYGYLQHARPQSTRKSASLFTNHGSNCLFYKTKFRAHDISLPVYNNFEVLGCYIRGSAVNILVIVVYRSGSATVTNEFFDDFDSILDRAATFASSLVIISDINIHSDAATNPNTIKFNQTLDSHGLVQHVVGLTHNRGHTLDSLITRKDATVLAMCVDVPSVSDHSFIMVSLAPGIDSDCHVINVFDRRRWRRDFDSTSFTADLINSRFVADPPATLILFSTAMMKH